MALELVDYLSLLRRRGLYLLVGLIAGLLGGYVTAQSATSTYTSTLAFFVKTSRTDPSGLISSIAQVAMGPDLVTKVAGSPLIAQDLTVTAGQNGSSNILSIRVTAPKASEVSRATANYVTQLPPTYSAIDTASHAHLTVIGITAVQASSTHATRILVLGGVLGLAVGFGAALLREALDRSVRDPEDLASRTGLSLQGVVPTDRFTRGVITVTRPRSARAEAYRRLGASLRLAKGTDGDLRMVAVTSAVAREGKTTTAVNLAAVAADAGERVLLVDADLRDPSIHKLFSMEAAPGLSEVVSGRAVLADVLQSWNGFDVLTSGRLVSNPVELLRRAGLHDLLSLLRTAYDLVVVDTTATLAVVDAEIIGAQCDAVLLVSRLGSTPRGKTLNAVKVMRRGSSNVWGVVANFGSGGEQLPGSRRHRAKAADWSAGGLGSTVEKDEPAAVSETPPETPATSLAETPPETPASSLAETPASSLAETPASSLAETPASSLTWLHPLGPPSEDPIPAPVAADSPLDGVGRLDKGVESRPAVAPQFVDLERVAELRARLRRTTPPRPAPSDPTG